MTQTFMYSFKIKSKYIGEWQNRFISLDFNRNLLGVSQYGVHIYKYFSLNDIYIQLKQHDTIQICTKSGRFYLLKGSDAKQVLHKIDGAKILSKIAKNSFQNNILSPKNIDYHSISKLKMKKIQIKIQKPSSVCSLLKTQGQKFSKRSYLLQKDWEINNQDGGLILINEQKKKNQGKILKFLLKKVLSSGSFMGISFPVFAMKPQSILETYCKSFGSAPLLFSDPPDDKVERIKLFVVFIFTFSRLFSDMDKPFNPVLGETFQAKIANGDFFAQQTCHHPPQSSIYFQGGGYIIYATLELDAKIGINSATGCFIGDITIQFQDGQKMVAQLLSGQMSGFIIGQNKFKPTGAYYVYDSGNQIACTYELQEKDIFRGYIGKLNKNFLEKFQQKLKNKERFRSFRAIAKKDHQEIYSQIEASWTKYVSFDKKIMISFSDPTWYAYEPIVYIEQLLGSDSRKRKDIKYRQAGQLQQAQYEKQKIQQEERYLRKLRTSFKK